MISIVKRFYTSEMILYISLCKMNMILGTSLVDSHYTDVKVMNINAYSDIIMY